MYAAEVAKEADAIASELVSPTEAPPLTVGQALKMRRLALGLKQHDVAAVAHVSRGQVSDLESGRRSASNTVAAVSAALATLEQARKEVSLPWRS